VVVVATVVEGGKEKEGGREEILSLLRFSVSFCKD